MITKYLQRSLLLGWKKVIPSLVPIDQVGFIRGRLAANNMRRLFYIISRTSSLQHPAVALSPDAEKAFD